MFKVFQSISTKVSPLLTPRKTVPLIGKKYWLQCDTKQDTCKRELEINVTIIIGAVGGTAPIRNSFVQFANRFG